MFQKMWNALPWRVYRRKREAYRNFLALLAQSPMQWTISDDGHIRSCEDECPLVHVYQRLTGARGLISDHENAHFAADLMGISLSKAALIIHAADRALGFSEEMRVRNDILMAIRRAQLAQERKHATAESSESAELVSV